MSRKLFKSENDYVRYKQREHDRYYGRTLQVPPRVWEDWEEEYLIENADEFAIDIARYLHRTVKSVEHRRSVLRKLGKL